MSVYDLSDILRGDGEKRWLESGRDSGIGDEWWSTRDSLWRGDITKNYVSYKPYKWGVSVGSLTSVGQCKVNWTYAIQIWHVFICVYWQSACLPIGLSPYQPVH